MKSLHDFSIRHQLIIIIFGIALVSMSIASTAFVWYDHIDYQHNMRHELTVLARIIADRVAIVGEDEDHRKMQRALEALASQKTIISACVTDDAGKRIAYFARSGQPPDNNACLHHQEFIFRVYDNQMDLIQPILDVGGQKLGELHLREDLSLLDKRLWVYSAVTLLIVLLVSLVAIILSFSIQKYVSSPMRGLVDVLRKVAVDQDYSRRMPVTRGDEIGQLASSLNHMLEAIETQNKVLLRARETLADQVEERALKLKNANHELEAFIYSVSHDLRAPLRAVDGFSRALLEDYGARLDEVGRDYLNRIRSASLHMSKLIDSLLYLSRVSRQEMRFEAVDLAEIAREVEGYLRETFPESRVQFSCPDILPAYGDRDLLVILLQNLMENAWKYSATVPHPRVELGVAERDGEKVYCVRDNGIGFDMKYVDNLFVPFQRLHQQNTVEGTGIGLATVYRIVHRHGGEIWAESKEGSGTVFYFILADAC